METEFTQKKKWYKKKKVIIPAIIVGVVLVAVAVRASRRDTAPQYETTTVMHGNLTQTVDASGNVASADELDLRFESSGRVARVYKKANDNVKKGQLIATLDLSELNARVAQASAGVARVQSNLDKILAGETDAYISNLKAKRDQAQANLDQTTATTHDAIANAEAALSKAKYNLDISSENAEDSRIVQDTYEDMVALLQGVQNTLSDALTESDNILGVDNVFANDGFENVLSTLNTSVLNQAKSDYLQAKITKKNFDTLSNTISIHSRYEDIDNGTDTAEEALLMMKTLLFSVSTVLDNTIPIGNLSQSELDTLKSGIATERTSVNTDYTSLINQTQAIRTAKNSYGTYLVAYNQAQTNYKNALLKADADIAVYEALFAQAQANLDDAKNPPRQEDVKNSQASLNEAYASLSQAVALRNKSRIVAPIDGIIGKIDAKVGEYSSASDIVVKMISPHFEISVDIPETDISKISLGDEASIHLDAFSDDVEFKGSVTEIEVGETIIQDVIYYSVTVSLEDDDHDEYNILNGMSANILFFTEEKEDVLYIPQRVVRSDERGKYVRVLKDDMHVEDVFIETGLRADDGLVEVLSGLEEGHVIVVRELS